MSTEAFTASPWILWELVAAGLRFGRNRVAGIMQRAEFSPGRAMCSGPAPGPVVELLG